MTATTRTALASFAVVLGMIGLTAAAVPLYDLFCRVTGYGGTTVRSEAATGPVAGPPVTVRFNADVAGDLRWSFRPVQQQVSLAIGEQKLAFYEAVNRSDRPVVGTATFNVTPHGAGLYFAKIECFCFQEQVLEPGEKVQMPVSFFVDPSILEDPAALDIRTITLSYTFFEDREATSKLLAGDGGASSPADG
ncbi:MAG: cytochrome c oxidase assembly protein [Geminicoccaceae bacterium]